MTRYNTEKSAGGEIHCHMCGQAFKTPFVLRQHLYRHYRTKFVEEYLKGETVRSA